LEGNLPVENNMSPQGVTVPVTTNKTENKQSSLCENKNLHNVIEPSVDELDNSYTPANVDQEFIQATKPFMNAVDTYKLWNRVLILIAYKKTKIEKPLCDVVVDAFKQSVFSKKLRKIRSTFEGYFYSVVYAGLVVEKRRECKHLFYDFLA
jgi:hypothetical protein